MDTGIHDLTAGYALDALDPEERVAYERHLATCERCREELASFWTVSGALAHAVAGPEPSPSLRARILDGARAETPNVVPLRRRSWSRPLAAAAAVAALTAVAAGTWAVSLSRDLDDRRAELAVLADPRARSYSSAGGEARLVVAPDGGAALVVRTLAPAPAGKDYEIWVLDGGVPRRAGLFDEPGVALLTRSVDRGQTVAVTLERDGGVEAPTAAPLFTAEAV